MSVLKVIETLHAGFAEVNKHGKLACEFGSFLNPGYIMLNVTFCVQANSHQELLTYLLQFGDEDTILNVYEDVDENFNKPDADYAQIGKVSKKPPAKPPHPPPKQRHR